MDRVNALLRYWKRCPPTNELVRNLFEISDDDDFDLPEGLING